MPPFGWVKPPSDFDPQARELWTRLIVRLRDQGTWQPSDAGALERYVRAVTRARRAQEELNGQSLVVEGARGQPVAHPALRIARDAERDSAEYGRDLLLTPKSRRAGGVSETSSIDDELAHLLGDS